MKSVICGIGNPLRGDDGIGYLVVKTIQHHFKDGNILPIACGSTPENYVQKIRRFCPDNIVIIDAVDMGKPTGTVTLIDIQTILGRRMSTHRLPINIFIEYLKRYVKAKIIFIGIQPKSISFNAKISAECKNAVKKVIKKLYNLGILHD